jgi:hypothetical protein
LPAEVTVDHALMDHAPVRIIGAVGRIRMAQPEQVDATFPIRNSLDAKSAMVGWMDTESVVRPARHGQREMRAGVAEMVRGEFHVGRERQAVQEENLTGGTRDHGPVKVGQPSGRTRGFA